LHFIKTCSLKEKQVILGNLSKKKKRVVISVTNDLVTDQRVNRIATTLHNNGYEVLAVGNKFKDSVKTQRPYKTRFFRLMFTKKMFFYAEYNIRLFFFLLFVKADIFLSNDTDTLPANYLASWMRRKKLVFDAHEMFPEVPEIVGRHTVKKVWTKIENMFFPKLKNCYTVCQSIADVYNERYGINMQVIRNISIYKPAENEGKKIHHPDKKILLYQGAVNVGRGIEWTIDAMPYIDNAVFYVVGDGDILQQLKNDVAERKLDDRVIFLGRIPFEELHAHTISADLGISLLENKGRNYYYSLPNRIFDFMHAHVPIIATDFPEIRKVVAGSGTGVLIDDYEPKILAQAIQAALTEWENKSEKTAIFDKACKQYNWETEEQHLLTIFETLK
jgi:glycosyltransferase involved in cell wall biosynthesis